MASWATQPGPEPPETPFRTPWVPLRTSGFSTLGNSIWFQRSPEACLRTPVYTQTPEAPQDPRALAPWTSQPVRNPFWDSPLEL